jgi:hypothetical protein
MSSSCAFLIFLIFLQAWAETGVGARCRPAVLKAIADKRKDLLENPIA